MTSDALAPQNQAGLPHNLAVNHASTAGPASPPNKRDLKSWWKGFILPIKHQDTHGNEQSEIRTTGIFGVPLRQSITYANVAISLIDENGQSYIYGYVPIVVAKCGVFLKEKATGVEGIFRLSGSEKRIKELKTIFDSPDRYGKGLVWEGYTVHDAANVLRRYLNDLPEPVVPLDLYGKFREPLRGATKQTAGDAEGPQFVDNFDIAGAITRYQKLITELPPLNRQLLLYILDLLAVFAAKADENRMNSQNLAAIFQPGMLSHPNHAMAPDEYRLNQCVIIFLIENQDNFLIGMHGTATDEKTVKEIESGQQQQPVVALPATPLSITKNSSLGRSASNASAGAESVRRDGKIRRNQSTSSRHSRHSRHETPKSPISITTPTSGGLTRSNTVPSKKSPHLHAGRFHQRERLASPSVHTPASDGLLGATDEIAPAETSPTASSNPSAMGTTTTLIPGPYVGPGRSQERLLDPHDAATPVKDRKLPAFFSRSPPNGDGEPRQPNKLKKKRVPGNLPSAASSTASLPQSVVLSPKLEATSPVDKGDVPTLGASDTLHPGTTGLIQSGSDVPSELTPKASQMPSTNNLAHPEAPKGQKSPPGSIHSSYNEGSDLDQTDDQVSRLPDQPEIEKRRRWRLSRPTKKEDGSPIAGLTSPKLGLGSNNNAEISTLSIGSGSRPSKSLTSDSSDLNALGLDMIDSKDRENRDDSKGPIGWIRNKYREAKGNVDPKRNKSPPADRHPASESLDALSDESRSVAQSTTSPVPAQGQFPSNSPQSSSQSNHA